MPGQSKTNRKADGKRARQNNPRLPGGLPTAVSIMVLIVGLAATLLLVRASAHSTEREDHDRFEKLCERVQYEAAQRMETKQYGLAGTRGTFVASDYVSYDAFSQMIASRDIEREFPGAIGFSYAERVPDTPDAIDAYVQKLHEEGMTGYKLFPPRNARPVSEQVIEDRIIVKYTRNQLAMGLDFGSDAVRRETAEHAARTGKAYLSERIELAAKYKGLPGFIYLLPHYQNGMPTDTAAQRLDAVRGWVCMPIIGPAVFESIESVAHDELKIEVYCDHRMTPGALVYDSDGQDQAGNHTACEGGALQAAVPIDVGGRQWSLHLSTSPNFSYASKAQCWTIGLCGSALSLLLAALAYSQGVSTRRAQSLAEGMTADLREFANKATQATQAKSDFLANMSHEIRTPMTAILGYTDLLSDQLVREDQALGEHIKTIKRNGEHLLTVINDILDVSKIEAGQLHIERVAVQPVEIVSEVLSLMVVKANEKDLTLSAELLTPIPRHILSDPVRLHQILVNLVGNAIKFTEEGAVKVIIRYDEKTKELEFAVTDTGIGMTPEHVSRLFCAFEQADTTTTRQFGGTGLGLHISQRLADRLGGTITCHSQMGHGSSFTLAISCDPVDATDMLPACQLVETTLQRTPKSSATDRKTDPSDQALRLDGIRILLAEDGKDNQRLINHYLTKAGAHVKIVENGRLAVESLCVHRDITGPLLDPPPFDILLTDMQMPEMDGYTAAGHLRRLGSKLPIVALTAHAMKEDADKCLNAGCDFYASKPIDKQQLIDLCVQAYEARDRGASQGNRKPSAA